MHQMHRFWFCFVFLIFQGGEGGMPPDPPRLRICYADAHVASALPMLH